MRHGRLLLRRQSRDAEMRAHVLRAQVREAQRSGSRFSAEGWRDRCVGRVDLQSPNLADLGREEFDPPQWVVPATPAAMMERGREVGPRAQSLQRARADRNCNGLRSHSRGNGRMLLHSHAARAEHSARAWPPGPYRRSSCDALTLTSRANRRGHDWSRPGPPQRPARSASIESWTETVPFELDATQTDSGAPLCCAQGTALVVHPLAKRFKTGWHPAPPSAQAALGLLKNRHLMDAAPARISAP